ncbi:MAG: hypothetical protein V7K38_18065 [Nostoc sp.]|uniref:hypothetical protein n=1 Tax=Nostoc sp. TaxID=1180 RepID=UPI002FFA8B29
MSGIKKATVNAKKKTLHSSQAVTERVQKLRCEYWEKVKEIDPDNIVFLDEMGVLLGLTTTNARSPHGTRAYDFFRPMKLYECSILSIIMQTASRICSLFADCVAEPGGGNLNGR